MSQLKVSNSSKWHNLSCTSPLSTIWIYDAWMYLDDCEYSFTYKELHELKNSCNSKFRCRYKKSRTKHLCDGWFRAKTKSIISYYCVYDHDDKSTTPVKVSSNKAVKVTTSEITNTQSSVSTSSTENYLTSSNSRRTPFEQNTGKTNAGVIAGSVFGVLGVLSLLLFLYCFLKRRKTIKQKDTSKSNATHAVGQNSNILYVVPENISSQTHDPPPAYTNPYDNPDQDHIYINNEAIMNTNSERQQANDYNHIHGAHINNSIQNDDYNHTDTGLNLPGRPGEEYNHISVSGRNVVTENQMDDGYNHIRNTEDMSHSIDDYNHINGQTGGQENKGYLNDDYNHLANSNGQNVPGKEQIDNYEDHLKQISNETSNSKNDYANIGIQERNNETVDFEPDDTYVYS